MVFSELTIEESLALLEYLSKISGYSYSLILDKVGANNFKVSASTNDVGGAYALGMSFLEGYRKAKDGLCRA